MEGTGDNNGREHVQKQPVDPTLHREEEHLVILGRGGFFPTENRVRGEADCRQAEEGLTTEDAAYNGSGSAIEMSYCG